MKLEFAPLFLVAVPFAAPAAFAQARSNAAPDSLPSGDVPAQPQLPAGTAAFAPIPPTENPPGARRPLHRPPCAAVYGGYAPAPWPPPPAELDDEQRPASDWYGWQTLTVDGAAIALMFVAASSDTSQDMAWLPALGYLLGPPIVHLAHGSAGKAAGTLGLRVGLPFIGMLAGHAAADCVQNHDAIGPCSSSEIAAGFFVGAAAAIAIDASLLAYESPRPTATRVREGADKRSGLVPVVGFDARGPKLGIGGFF